VQYTLIIGDEETRSGQFLLKEMTTGEQVSVTRELLFSRFTTTTDHGI